MSVTASPFSPQPAMSAPRRQTALQRAVKAWQRDKFLYLLTWGWNVGWVLIFAVATIFFLTRKIEGSDWSRYDSWWLSFWHTKIWIELAVAVVVIVWFTIGGVRDVKALLKTLSQKERDDADDGFVARDIPD